MTTLINPRSLRCGYDRLNDRRFPGGKVYRPIVGRHTRKVFKTANDATLYMYRTLARWCRLYDAAIMNLSATAEAGQP